MGEVVETTGDPAEVKRVETEQVVTRPLAESEQVPTPPTPTTVVEETTRTETSSPPPEK